MAEKSGLPPLPPYDTSYKNTTDYHWPDIHDDASSENGYQVVNGLFGFGAATKINKDKEQCLIDENWGNAKDVDNRCVQQYSKATCNNGLSFALWEKRVFPFLVYDEVTEEKEYILSTGGDETHPGIAIYHQGPFLKAVLSTDEEVWETFVFGQLRNNTWNNIAIRWEHPSNSADPKGLELFINMKRVSYTIYPERSREAKAALNPPTMMIGCHKTSTDTTPRFFAMGQYDEVAGWVKRISDNEILSFLGGYDEMFGAKTIPEWIEIFKRTDMKIAQLQSMAAHVANMATIETPSGGVDASEGSSIVNTNIVKTADHQTATLEQVSQLVDICTQLRTVPDTDTAEGVQKRLNIFNALSNLLVPGRSPLWKVIVASSRKKPGPAGLIAQFEDWLIATINSVVLKENQAMSFVKTSPNIALKAQKMMFEDLKDRAENGYYIVPPENDNEWDDAVSDFQSSKASFKFDLSIYANCTGSPFIATVISYKTYPQMASTRVNKIYNSGTENEVDSSIISIILEPATDAKNFCRVDRRTLNQKPMQSSFEHKRKEISEYSSRSLKAFMADDTDELAIYNVKRRHCVYWNEDISDYGVWDMKHCRRVHTNATLTKCECLTQATKYHTYTIIAELSDKMVPPDEQHIWLRVVKCFGYTLSVIFLIIFIIIVVKSKTLQDMFHLMSMHMAIAFLLGILCMLLTQLDVVRSRRLPCGLLSTFMQFFFTATATWLCMEAWAAFRAITKGVIAGKLRAYILISWGTPLISLGLSYAVGFNDYGTDNLCMISSENRTKWIFFGIIAALDLIATILVLIISCNLSTSAIRKECNILELQPVCQGLIVVVLWFSVTWCIGIPAYFGFMLNGSSFFPLFHILNAFMGILIFVFLGLFSPKFIAVINGKVDLRKKWLLSAALNEDTNAGVSSFQVSSSSEEDGDEMAIVARKIYVA